MHTGKGGVEGGYVSGKVSRNHRGGQVMRITQERESLSNIGIEGEEGMACSPHACPVERVQWKERPGASFEGEKGEEEVENFF